MTEVWFYHLQRRPLESVLPVLLERCLERGWRSLILTGSKERAEALDGHLWTFRDDSFLPHGNLPGPNAEYQPILLAAAPDAGGDTSGVTPNRANVLFLVDGAISDRMAQFERCVDLFDGNDAAATEAARGRYRQAREAGYEVTYWQQDADGGWVKRG
ncbi:MAG: DNA polymerase III subunit chi [Alphaproteobacteria bacterium]|nr:DNA polymerase III subunit chi [Alphaproteobacteria bacterium]